MSEAIEDIALQSLEILDIFTGKFVPWKGVLKTEA